MNPADKQKLAILGGLVVVLVVSLFIVDPFGFRGSGETVPAPAGGTTTDPAAAPPGLLGDQGKAGGNIQLGPGAAAPGASTTGPAIGGPAAGPGGMPSSSAMAPSPAAGGAMGGATPVQPAGPSRPPSLPSRVDPMAPLNPSLVVAGGPQIWSGSRIANLPPLSYASVFPASIEPPRTAVLQTKAPIVEARDMRLSGILLNGSLYVILETGTLTADPRGFVVKPGDEVEGIRILKIERYRENGQMMTRALVRTPPPELEERYVYLREGPPRQGGAGGGMPGGMMPGGMMPGGMMPGMIGPSGQGG